MSFIKNAWYVAAWSETVSAEQTQTRVILGESVLLFRDGSGNPVALSNRCPHRFAPLDQGVLRDGTIACPYHGLRFDAAGQCVHNPHGDGRIPQAARLRRYPVRERYNAIWIWTGDSALADSVELPAFPFLEPGDNEICTGYLETRAHYQLSADNLLDLSHFQYLHPDTLGSPSLKASPSAFTQHGETVWSTRTIEHEIPNPFVARAFSVPPGVAVDRWLNVRWDAPGLIAIEVGVTAAGAPRAAGRTSWSAHFLTPQTAASSHYFFAFGLPKSMGEAARVLVEYAIEGLMKPFVEEDLPILEAQQAALGDGDFWAMQPLMLSIDGGAIRARRIVERKLAEEAANATPPAPTIRMIPLARQSCMEPMQ